MKPTYFYMIVTADVYELPIFVSEDLGEIASYLGVSNKYAGWLFSPTASRRISGKRQKYKFTKVNYDEVMNLGIRGFEKVKDAPEDTLLPIRGSAKSAGYDFYAPCDILVPAHGRTGNIFLNVKAYMDNDEFLQLKIRSSLAVKHQLMLETSGVIDADYYGNETNDGNISVVFRNNGDTDINIYKNERCCQGIFFKYLTTENDTFLGNRKGGFGSTGK